MEKEIETMIELYEEDIDFYGPVPNGRIEIIENQLSVTFPNQYRNFLRLYGSGGICGVNILGVEGDMGSSLLERTEKYRKLGLRKDLIVIEDLGEFIICSETGNKKSILYWDSIHKKESVRYNNFDEYLFDTFKEAVDNWD